MLDICKYLPMSKTHCSISLIGQLKCGEQSWWVQLLSSMYDGGHRQKQTDILTIDVMASMVFKIACSAHVQCSVFE